MKLVDDATDEVVPTDENPIVVRGIGLRLRCRFCDTVFEADDAPRDIPGGHGKHVRIGCPECGRNVARVKGTNRRFVEDRVGLTVDEAFRHRCREDGKNPDDFELVVRSGVDPDDVGDTIVAAFEFYPHNGITNWLPVDGDDVFAADSEDVPSIIRGEYPVVEWYEGHYKPVGYPEEWDNDADDPIPPGRSDSYLRFVRQE